MSTGAVPAYAELHAHSCYSFLDGVSEPSELVEEAMRQGLHALALTDHNGMYGVVKFAKAARESSFTSVYGAEVTISMQGSRTKVEDPAGEHIVLLARNPKGYAELSSLLTRGHMDAGEKGHFMLSYDAVAEASTGNFFLLTGCRKGPVTSSLFADGPSAAAVRLAELVERFGRDTVVVECYDHGDPTDIVRNEALTRLAVAAGVTSVATGNVHYASPREGRLAHLVSAIRSSRTLDEIDGWLPGGHGAYLRSPAEQARRFARFPGLLERSVEIADACAFNLKLVSPNLPDFVTGDTLSEISFLRRLVEERAPARYGPRGSERVKGAYRQLDHELEIIEKLGFAGYFLVVWDIVEFARRSDIFCQGRGSAANSAVCYAIGITNCDPVSLRLLFERFLSPERDGPPDIDVDIESQRREEVIQYVYNRYGRDRAAQVANVITYRTRSSIREAAKALGYSPAIVDRWSKQAERFSSLEATLDVRNPDGSQALHIPDDVKRYSLELEHKPRHLGLHPGGMVICDRPIREVCPTEWARSANRSVLQWDKDDCADIGLVKFDLLGLGMLSALHHCVYLVRDHHGVEVDLALIPQDVRVYDMLCEADTVGVFQVESRAQMATLPRLRPRHFYDLVVEVALIRPGPIQGGSVHPYIRRRNGREPVTYLHPLLENSLSKTLGVPLFQEQLMQMAIDVANFSPADADQLRQAMGSKRSTMRMQRLKDHFYEGMASNGIIGEVADQIYNKLSAFANFGFPESHSASFAYLVYASAWFKLHYPAAFCAALVNAQPMGFWSTNTLVADARHHGVIVLGPEVGISGPSATLEGRPSSAAYVQDSSPRQAFGRSGPAVRLGIGTVRGVGAEVAARICSLAPYESIEDLALRARLNESQMTALARAGALSGIGGEPLSRRQALWLAGPVTWSRDAALVGLPVISEIPSFGDLTQRERYALDLYATGIVPDGHPIEILRSALDELGVVRSTALTSLVNGDRVKVAGVVTHRQRPHTAKGVTFINLEDEDGLVNVICSKGVWARFRRVAKTSHALLITGRLELYDSVVNVMAEKVEALTSAVTTRSRDFR